MSKPEVKSSPGGSIPAADFRELYLGTQFSCCTSPLKPMTFTHSGLLLTTSPEVVVHSFPRPPTYRCSSFTANHSALNPSHKTNTELWDVSKNDHQPLWKFWLPFCRQMHSTNIPSMGQNMIWKGFTGSFLNTSLFCISPYQIYKAVWESSLKRTYMCASHRSNTLIRDWPLETEPSPSGNITQGTACLPSILYTTPVRSSTLYKWPLNTTNSDSSIPAAQTVERWVNPRTDVTTQTQVQNNRSVFLYLFTSSLFS